MKSFVCKVAVSLSFLLVMVCVPAGSSPLLPMAGPAPATAGEAAPYFQGKTIEILAATAAGGGTDTSARITAAFLPRYIPGKPTIIVRNQPGASGVVAANSFYDKAKPDGLALFHASESLIAQQQRGRDIVKFDLRQLPFLGNIGAPGQAVCIRKDAVKRLKDPSAPPVIVGTRLGDETWEVVPVFGKELLGWNIKWLKGFGGTGEIVLALRRGEVDIFGDSENVKAVIKDGVAEPLAQLGLLKDGKFVARSDLPNMPIFPDLMGDKRPTGVAWEAYMSLVVPSYVFKYTTAAKGTPDNIVNILVDAYAKMAKDPEFNDTLKKSFAEEYEISVGKESEKLLKMALDVSPEALAYLAELYKRCGLSTE